MVNNVVLVGKVIDDPRYSVLPDSGARVCNFALAVRRETRDDNNYYESDIIPLSAWFGTADVVRDFVTKGSVIGVRGRIYMRQQETNGQKFNNLNVIVEHVNFIQLAGKMKDDSTIDENPPNDELGDDELEN